MVIFSLQNTKNLAENIARANNWQIGRYIQKNFSDGEEYIRLENDIKDKNVLFVGALETLTDIFQFFLLSNAAKNNGAKNIFALVTYLGYCRQDRVVEKGEPISLEVISGMFNSSGIKKLFIVDWHSDKIKKYLKIPAVNLIPLDIFTKEIKKIKNLVLVGPDAGAADRIKLLSQKLKLPMAILKKIRPAQEKAKIIEMEDGVEGKNIAIVDDMIETGGTIVEAAKFLRNHGAKDIYVLATHGIFSGKARENLQNPSIKSILVTNSLRQKIKSDKIKYMPLGNWIAWRIKTIDTSVTKGLTKINPHFRIS